jgi:hypothetical protein
MSDTQTNTQTQYDEFTQNLVTAMLGVQISSIKDDKKEEMVEKCKSIFKDFIYGYFTENFTQIDLIRLKASQSQEGMFEKFPDLVEKFEKAYAEFLKQLEISWEEPKEEQA